MKERREHKRITKSFMSWLRFVPDAHKDKSFAYPVAWDIVTTRDLSAGGMLFNYDKRIDIGIGARFKIIFPFANHLIECTGKVIRDEKVDSFKYPSVYRIAVQFENISSLNKKLIDKIANLMCA